jgi:hypothetical protein
MEIFRMGKPEILLIVNRRENSRTKLSVFRELCE